MKELKRDNLAQSSGEQVIGLPTNKQGKPYFIVVGKANTADVLQGMVAVYYTVLDGDSTGEWLPVLNKRGVPLIVNLATLNDTPVVYMQDAVISENTTSFKFVPYNIAGGRYFASIRRAN